MRAHTARVHTRTHCTYTHAHSQPLCVWETAGQGRWRLRLGFSSPRGLASSRSPSSHPGQWHVLPLSAPLGPHVPPPPQARPQPPPIVGLTAWLCGRRGPQRTGHRPPSGLILRPVHRRSLFCSHDPLLSLFCSHDPRPCLPVWGPVRREGGQARPPHVPCWCRVRDRQGGGGGRDGPGALLTGYVHAVVHGATVSNFKHTHIHTHARMCTHHAHTHASLALRTPG